MVSPLPLSVSWYPGETALSLANHLARRNFASNMTQFAQDTGFDFAQLLAGDATTVDHIAALAGVPASSLRSSTLVRIGPAYELNGERIERSSTRQRNLRCCPICLLEGEPYARFWWSIEPCRACVKHSTPHVPLITSGFARSHDLPAFVDSNEDHIRQIAEAAGHTIPHSGELYLLKRVRRLPREPVWLDNVSFSGAAKAMDVFGAVARFGKDANIKNLRQADLTAAAATGFDILKEGEHGIRQMLGELMRNPSLPSISGPQKVFGAIFKWLYDPGMADVDAVKDVVREFCLENFAIEPGSMLLGKTVASRRRHSILSLTAAFGISPKTTPKILRAAGLLKDDDPRPPGLTTFPYLQAERVMEKYCNGLSTANIDRYLNIPRPHRVALCKAGYLI